MDLSEALAGLAVELPGVLLDEIASAIESVAGPGVQAAGAIARNVTQPRARGLALELCDTWESSAPQVTGAALALAFRACAATAHSIRGAQTVELAWTGPQTAVPLRKTREALRDLTRNAQSSLILVSFSAYRDDDITAQLADAALRGVEHPYPRNNRRFSRQPRPRSPGRVRRFGRQGVLLFVAGSATCRRLFIAHARQGSRSRQIRRTDWQREPVSCRDGPEHGAGRANRG